MLTSIQTLTCGDLKSPSGNTDPPHKIDCVHFLTVANIWSHGKSGCYLDIIGTELVLCSEKVTIIQIAWENLCLQVEGHRGILDWDRTLSYSQFWIGNLSREPHPALQSYQSRASITRTCRLHHSGSICRNTCGMNIYQQSGTIKVSESEIN